MPSYKPSLLGRTTRDVDLGNWEASCLAPPTPVCLPAGADKARDLAVLKVNAPAALLRPVMLGDSSAVSGRSKRVVDPGC